MKKCLLFLIVFLCQTSLIAQQDAWVYLKDKQNVETALANPISILTQKAIDRKTAHNVSIDARDVPVNEAYISQLKNTTGITVMAKSKWFNAVHVRGSETDIKNLSTTFPFIERINFANKTLNTNKAENQKATSKLEGFQTVFNYGNSRNQIEMFRGNELHLADFTGQGITVAVLDAGFPNVNTMSSFKRMRDSGRLLGSYDFVNRKTDVYTNTTSNHGTLVLSDMVGHVENQFVGTAPDASYYLFITEDAPRENPVEESYWVEAAERADSLGVDVVNTSLGYTTYDNLSYSYSPSDMNGNTAFITKGANIAFEKGMLLVTSAGNSGNDSWQIVGAPADAAGVLSIGAVKADGTYASFSSRGNATQPTRKPDIVAQGQAIYVITPSDNIGTANGTSFSSPILAGGIVCLWQALPSLNNSDIMQLVRESASQYNSPDYLLGFGIPNLQVALNNGLAFVDENNRNIPLNVYPNPANSILRVTLSLEDLVELQLFDTLGKLIMNQQVTYASPNVDISELSNGLYIVKLILNKQIKTVKLLKE